MSSITNEQSLSEWIPLGGCCAHLYHNGQSAPALRGRIFVGGLPSCVETGLPVHIHGQFRQVCVVEQRGYLLYIGIFVGGLPSCVETGLPVHIHGQFRQVCVLEQC